MNGGLASHLLPFISNVSSAYLAHMSKLNINVGIAFEG
jgi:hypothetical protein